MDRAEQHAGTYQPKLYGRFRVEHDDGQLVVTFGPWTTAMSHWQGEAFYVRAPRRLTFDWLLTFDVSDKGTVGRVIVTHVGWDKDEKDHAFTRIIK
jgi:hypothetical protein